MSAPSYRKNDITILRTLSMLMIVLCHIIRYYTFIPGSQFLGQILDVGVFVFLLISGYLYGFRERKPFGKFILTRALRIGMPTLIVLIIDAAVLFFFFDEKYDFSTLICYLFNLQGLAFVCWDLFSCFFVQIENLGPLWFASIIMICYCMLPLCYYIRGRLTQKKQWLILLGALAFCGALQYVLNVNLFYFLTFYFGFLLADSKKSLARIPNFKFAILCAILTTIQFLRLLLLILIDGSQLYMTFVSYSHISLGLLLFVVVVEMNKRIPKIFDAIANCWVVKKLDKISFHIYLVHGVFCFGVTNIYKAITNIILATFVYFILVSLATILLYYLDKLILIPSQRLLRKIG